MEEVIQATTPGPAPRPRPIRQFIVKIHGRCDMACDYCYVFRMPDQEWRNRPRSMSAPVVDALAGRIAEHVRRHRIPAVEVVLHGGEPLLAGEQALEYTVDTIRRAVRGAGKVRVVVQTNGLRLTPAVLDMFVRHRIGISVSLDGDRDANDRHRRTAGGRGTFDAVAAALHRVNAGPARELFRGLLCTIDLDNPPVETYLALKSFRPPMIDFLLPHGNWTQPPPGLRAGSSRTPYAEWLIAVFDHWYAEPAEDTRIRRFEQIIGLLLGGHSGLEGVGLSYPGSVVIETDGSLVASDSLTSAFPGATRSGLHLHRDDFDAVLNLPEMAERRSGRAGLPATCRACALHPVCGGGLRTHRYRSGAGFDNPSVYCRDLARLIGHIRGRLQQDVTRLQSEVA
ncbi:FxsB family cyclophane-forming radical SAM/SPASM peptide maturase [Actinoplanes sp. NPDC049802]|uniref:FxsB family cyclophane-forming radical SAM/SPASM peptide maturase n=1 Tax=Actinoplanes sp. NPDC049802 TaxID=3154742 RepID=UPI0033DB49E7